MHTLTSEQKRRFHELGYVALPGLMLPREVAVLREETHRVFSQQREEVIRTEEGQPRVAFVMDRYSEIFRKLLSHPRLLAPLEELIGEPFYCHQYKIVTKHPLGRQALPWHQDFGTWHETDGMPLPRAVTIGLLLEDITEFNGALAFVPGSNKGGLLPSQSEYFPGKKVPSVTLDPGALVPLIEARGIDAPKGPAGTVLLFDSTVVHGSGPNLGGGWRHIVYITANPVSNRLVDPQRGDMYALRDFTPMRRLDDVELDAPSMS